MSNEPDLSKIDPEVKETVENLIEDLRAKLFHHTDEEARPVIDDFLNNNLIMLTVHSRDWYHEWLKYGKVKRHRPHAFW